MDIPGVHTILDQPASIVWAGEPDPPEDRVTLFERAAKALKYGQLNDAEAALTQILRSNPEGSQEMRLHYLQGNLFSDVRDYDQAHRFYEMALDVATAGNDPDSQIVLIYLMGQMRYGAMRNREAQHLYEIVFELWSTRAKQLPHPPIDPEVKIRQCLGQVLWLIGEFEDAHATLGRALILAQYQHRIEDHNALREQVAGALWTLALVHRSQSDMLDGDAGYLRTALRRADKALGLFQRAATDQINLARFHIQIAEIYLDLAEAHRSRGGISAMRYTLHRAVGHIDSSEEYLDPQSDQWAPLLAKLTGLRYDIMLLSPLALAMKIAEIEERLEVIERTAEEFRDHILTAKAATLRAEWLLSLGDTETARTALLLALKGFADDGMGQATRAQRLLRRITNEQDISRP